MANTTVPAPAPAPTATTSSSSSSSSSCGTPLDYALVRKNNIATITENYNKLLDTYTKKYTEYSTNVASSKQSDQTYARLTLKPQTEAYNTQIINISKELMNSVNKDTDLIVLQTKELEKKSKELTQNIDDITLLKERSAELKIEEQSHEDSVKSTQSGSDDLHFTTQIYMGINMLLVLIVIGLIIYLVYSNFTSKKNNTTNSSTMNSMNNIYKNIKVNNSQ